MLMIEPPRWRIMMGSTAMMKLNALLRLTAMTASHWASVMRIMSPSFVMPALLTRMSIEPKSLCTSATTSFVWLKSAAFEAYPFTLTPRASISFSVALPFSSITRSVNAMLAPSCAKRSASAFPIPRAAPVMSAVFPSRSFMYIILNKNSGHDEPTTKLTII